MLNTTPPNRSDAFSRSMRPALAATLVRAVTAALGCSLLAFVVALLAGCAAIAPDSIVEPVPAVSLTPAALPTLPQSGAIYAADSYRALFEDRRARQVGDMLIITISERTSAGKNVGNSSSKDGKLDVRIPGPYIGADLEASQGVSNADKAAANAANNFTGTVSVSVTEVLPNGYLRVRGEKQIAFDRGTEFIRFSGVVNPATLGGSNTVPSTAVADMRVEYRTGANYDRATLQAALARFFFSILPL